MIRTLHHPLVPNTFLLSDVHLGGFDQVTNASVLHDVKQVLQFCAKHRYHLIILGDLFDYWMEYDGKYPDLAEPLKPELEAIRAYQGRIPFVTGNHDNWTANYLETLGFQLIQDAIFATNQEVSLLLMHGDGLSDASFQFPRPALHRFLRHPDFLHLYRHLPTEWGIFLCKWFSRISRFLSNEAHEDEVNRLNTAWKPLLHKCASDGLLCGHDHHHRLIIENDGFYLNLGAFFQHRTFGLYTEREVQLVRWHSSDVTFSVIQAHAIPTK